MSMGHSAYMGLRGEFVKRGIRYPEIAKLLSISMTTLSNKITGKSDFSLTEAKTISEKYNIPYDLF